MVNQGCMLLYELLVLVMGSIRFTLIKKIFREGKNEIR